MSSNNGDLLSPENVSFNQAGPIAFRILLGHWKHLVLMTLAYYLACAATGLVIGAILVAEDFGLISKLINQIPGVYLPDFSSSSSDVGYARRLLGENSIQDNSFFDRASRVLQEDAQSAFEGLDDIKNLLDQKGIFFIAALVLVALLIITFIASVYTGGVIHAVAEVYTGEVPNALKSLKYGWSTKLPVYINSIFYMLAIVLVGAITVGIPGVYSDGYRYLVLGFIVFYVMLLISSLLFTATSPAIVIEKASAVGAFMRSVRLCKNDLCVLFLINIVVGVIMNVYASILMGISEAIGIPDIISHPIINIPVALYPMILQVVLYMILRGKHENYTKEDLCQELLNQDGGTIVNAIELSDCEQQKMTIT